VKRAAKTRTAKAQMAVVPKRPCVAGDLIELWHYIAEDNVPRADASVNDADAKFCLLAEQACRSREELAPGVRSFPLGWYVIFYEVIPDGVAIVRVLHGARDLGPLFEGE
jgi:toxin ParE1/3/4